MRRALGVSSSAVLCALLALAGCSEGADVATSADPESSASPSEAHSESPGSDPSGTKSGQESGKAASNQQVQDDGPGAPGSPTKNGRQSDVFERLPGQDSSDCIVVGTSRDVRSGGIVGGAFDEAKAQFGTGEPGRPKGMVRLYWIPMHTKPMPGVTVKATNTRTGNTTTHRQQRVADTDQWKFYDTMLAVDEPGRWRFAVTSGRDRGCFDVEFP